MIILTIVKKSQLSYRYELRDDNDLLDTGYSARPKKVYDMALEYCKNHNLVIDKMNIPHSLRRIWGFGSER